MGKRVISAILTLKDKDFSTNLRRASDRSDDFGRGVTRVGNQIQRFGQGATKAFKAVGVGAAALGSAGIVALGTGVAKTIFDMNDAFNTLQVQTGATASQMEVYGSAAKEVFGKGYGESIDEVTNALARVKQNMTGLDNGEISKVTSNAMLLADKFESDVNEVTRGANNLMQAFGISSDKAFDLFTAGGQRGLNFSNEMFDNVAEYSSLFGAMGYSVEDYFGIMERGAKSGVYNLDYVNDVMKEFQIRIKDGSKSTDEAMSVMSKSTFDLWESFNKGEATVAEVAGAVTKELKGMENQVEAGQLAVSLFGTKWEDLEADAMYAMLGSTEAMTGFEGAMDAASSKIEKSFKNRLISSWRQLQVGISDVVNGAGAQEFLNTLADKSEELVPKIQGVVEKAFEFGNTIRDNWGPIKETVIGASTAVGVLAVGMGALKVVSTVTTLVQGFRTALALATAGQWAMNTALLASPFTWIVIGIAAVVAAGVTLYRNSEQFREGWDTAWNGIKSATEKGVNFVIDKVNKMIGLINNIPGIEIPDIPTVDFTPTESRGTSGLGTSTKTIDKSYGLDKKQSFGLEIDKSYGIVEGNYAVGANRITHDQTANIHKDEMIIPARQAERVRAAGGNIDNIDQMIQPTKSTEGLTVTSSPNASSQSQTGGVTVIIQNLNAKAVTAKELVDEFVPMLKLRLANL